MAGWGVAYREEVVHGGEEGGRERGGDRRAARRAEAAGQTEAGPGKVWPLRRRGCFELGRRGWVGRGLTLRVLRLAGGPFEDLFRQAGGWLASAMESFF